MNIFKKYKPLFMNSPVSEFVVTASLLKNNCEIIYALLLEMAVAV